MATLKPLWSALSDIASRLDETRTLYLACDDDGTLTPIADHPDAARIPARARAVLERLGRHEDVRIAVLSGRTIEDLDHQLRLPGAFLSGASGLETRAPGGGRVAHVPPEDALPPELLQEMEAWCKRFPGSWLENKQVAWALHYRRVTPDLQPAFGAGVRRRARPHAQRVTLVHGKQVFEVRPVTSWDRASALDLWLETIAEPGLLFYFGDDTADEPAYDKVRSRGGYAVAVDRTVSRAEYVLPSSSEVIWFLEWLAREWETRPAPVRARDDVPAYA